MKLKFDNERLLEAVRVVRVINPHAAAHTEASLADWVKKRVQAAHDEAPGGDFGYWACLGFTACQFTNPAGELEAHISVMPYTVAQYIKGRG